MKRPGFTLLEALVIVAIASILSAIIWPVFNRTHCNDRASACHSHLRYLATICANYRADYDGRFARTALHDGPSLPPYPQPYGWADALYPYFGQLYLFQCPSELNQNHTLDARAQGFTDYWYNDHLSNLPSYFVPSPNTTILFGEGGEEGQGSNARYALNGLPPSWLDSSNSPLLRHYRGANFAFADGHVKWLAPGELGEQSRGIDNYAFTP